MELLASKIPTKLCQNQNVHTFYKGPSGINIHATDNITKKSPTHLLTLGDSQRPWKLFWEELHQTARVVCVVQKEEMDKVLD